MEFVDFEFYDGRLCNTQPSTCILKRDDDKNEHLVWVQHLVGVLRYRINEHNAIHCITSWNSSVYIVFCHVSSRLIASNINIVNLFGFSDNGCTSTVICNGIKKHKFEGIFFFFRIFSTRAQLTSTGEWNYLIQWIFNGAHSEWYKNSILFCQWMSGIRRKESFSLVSLFFILGSTVDDGLSSCPFF